MAGYTKEELQSPDLPRFPDRGEKCARCGSRVPEFSDVPKEVAEEIQLLAASNKIEAMSQIQKASGCNARWAKIWVAHPNGVAKHKFSGPPCPHCGEPLPNERSKQCLSCGNKWHKPETT